MYVSNTSAVFAGLFPEVEPQQSEGFCLNYKLKVLLSNSVVYLAFRRLDVAQDVLSSVLLLLPLILLILNP